MGGRAGKVAAQLRGQTAERAVTLRWEFAWCIPELPGGSWVWSRASGAESKKRSEDCSETDHSEGTGFG